MRMESKHNSLRKRERERFKLYIVSIYMNGTWNEVLFVCDLNFILPTTWKEKWSFHEQTPWDDTHLIDEFNALQKHVVLVVLVNNLLLHKVSGLQGWVVYTQHMNKHTSVTQCDH